MFPQQDGEAFSFLSNGTTFIMFGGKQLHKVKLHHWGVNLRFRCDLIAKNADFPISRWWRPKIEPKVKGMLWHTLDIMRHAQVGKILVNKQLFVTSQQEEPRFNSWSFQEPFCMEFASTVLANVGFLWVLQIQSEASMFRPNGDSTLPLGVW